MITRKFSNCSSSRFHHGVSGALFSRLCPYCCRRCCTSDELRPRAALEPSAATTASAGLACGADVSAGEVRVRSSWEAIAAGLVCRFMRATPSDVPVRHRSVGAARGARSGVQCVGLLGFGCVSVLLSCVRDDARRRHGRVESPRDDAHQLLGIDRCRDAQTDQRQRAGDVGVGDARRVLAAMAPGDARQSRPRTPATAWRPPASSGARGVVTIRPDPSGKTGKCCGGEPELRTGAERVAARRNGTWWSASRFRLPGLFLSGRELCYVPSSGVLFMFR